MDTRHLAELARNLLELLEHSSGELCKYNRFNPNENQNDNKVSSPRRKNSYDDNKYR